MKLLTSAVVLTFILLTAAIPLPAYCQGNDPASVGAPGTAASAGGAAGVKAPASGDDAIYKASLAALTKLFVIAVLLESALAVIFHWGVFLAYFSSKGMKTIITVIVALIVVNHFKIDIVANLVAVYSKSDTPPSDWVSTFLTALILSGGSAGVNNIMTALGFRTNQQELELDRRPPNNTAWVAIRVKRKDAVGEVVVNVLELPAGDARAAGVKPIAGTVGTKRASLSELLLRNVNRFPPNGGYTLKSGVAYEITVQGKDANGAAITRLGAVYIFDQGAIVDFDVTL